MTVVEGRQAKLANGYKRSNIHILLNVLIRYIKLTYETCNKKTNHMLIKSFNGYLWVLQKKFKSIIFFILYNEGILRRREM